MLRTIRRRFWRTYDCLVGYCDSPSPPPPIVFNADGSCEARADTIEALERIVTRGYLRREQQEADIEEACRMLGVTPGCSSTPHDWCAQLADNATSVPEVIEKLAQRHKQAAILRLEESSGLMREWV